MAKKRVGVSKGLRFEVFKRDKFVCQYCGAHPPDAILHADHIEPVAGGGKTEIDNLVTACASCNLGKGAKSLASVPKPLAERAAEAREREEQLVGYQEFMRERRQRVDDESWEVVDVLEPGASESGFNIRDRISIKRFIEKLGFERVMEAAEIAYGKCRSSEYQRFKYFCGVCWKMLREIEDARA